MRAIEVIINMLGRSANSMFHSYDWPLALLSSSLQPAITTKLVTLVGTAEATEVLMGWVSNDEPVIESMLVVC